MIRCLLLTTDTRHHRYFADRIARCAELTVVLEEKGPARPARSPFRRLQDRFEQESFNGVSERFEAPGGLHRFRSGNQPECEALIHRVQPDLLVTFGTGRILPAVYRLGRLSLNVHRGILPDYRGLDSDLWAVYQRDFGNVGTTLHLLEEKLDTGPVLLQHRLQLRSGMRAHHLRYHTTLLAAEMAEQILRELRLGNLPAAVPQDLTRGTTLSAIPPLKRWLAGRRLQRHLDRRVP